MTRILLLMSGSIACAKASGLVSAWRKAGHEIEVACTRSVAQFLGHATLEGFSGRPVLGDAFEPGRVMDHIHLAQWADIVVAAPATSNLINKFATGIADDVATSLWQAAWGRGMPMLMVPAMNTQMWRYPATQESLAKLRHWGVHILQPASGALACGEQGDGRMLEVDEILQQVDTILQARAVKPAAGGKRVLVTAGGTREPIDSVRYIGNMSTGGTAASLCDSLLEAGHEVVWLGAASARRPALPCEQATYVSFKDLQERLRDLLAGQRWDAVIHAAAVSDYSVAAIEQGETVLAAGSAKLASDAAMTLKLQPNPKLLDALRGWSKNPAVRIIGFKLTDTSDADKRTAAVQRLFDRAGVDAVVHNDLGEIQSDRHCFTLHSSAGEAEPCANVQQLGRSLARLIGEQTP